MAAGHALRGHRSGGMATVGEGRNRGLDGGHILSAVEGQGGKILRIDRVEAGLVVVLIAPLLLTDELVVHRQLNGQRAAAKITATAAHVHADPLVRRIGFKFAQQSSGSVD